MFEFHWPWIALLLPLPLLVYWLWPRRLPSGRERPLEGRQTTLLHPAIERLQQSFQSRRPRSPLTGVLHALLLMLLWLLLLLALMRPQWLEPYTELKTPGYDLMIAVDASRSMTALDFTQDGRPVSRMAVLKGVLDRFIESREGDRVGLVIFGSQAFVQSPLTFDRNAVRSMVRAMEPGMAGDATAMGDAMALAIKRLRERPEGSRVLLLITDGDSNAGLIPPQLAARLAVAEGVRLYTIGVGSLQEEVPILAHDGQYRMERDMIMQEDLLIRLSQATGGAYFRATDSDMLEIFSQRIAALEQSEVEQVTTLIPTPLYRWPLGAALLILLLLGLFPEGRMRTPDGGNHG